MSTVAYKCPTIPPEDPVLPKLVMHARSEDAPDDPRVCPEACPAWDLHLHAWDPPACASGGSCMDQSLVYTCVRSPAWGSPVCPEDPLYMYVYVYVYTPVSVGSCIGMCIYTCVWRILPGILPCPEDPAWYPPVYVYIYTCVRRILIKSSHTHS